jgi:hypothetical protein
LHKRITDFIFSLPVVVILRVVLCGRWVVVWFKGLKVLFCLF